MLGRGKGARRFQQRVTLTLCESVVDALGHKSQGDPVPVATIWASVERMSATKTMMTFQQADIVGLDIEFRTPDTEYNGIEYEGHDVHFASPENMDERGRFVHIQGWYQVDNP